MPIFRSYSLSRIANWFTFGSNHWLLVHFISGKVNQFVPLLPLSTLKNRSLPHIYRRLFRARPLSYHRTVIRGTCPWCGHGRARGFGVLADRVPVDAQLPGDCPNGEAPKLSLLHGLPPNPLSRRGFPAWRCRRLANSAVAGQCGAVGLDDAEGCQALLGVVAHPVDPTVKVGAISERTIGGTENSRARRRLLCGDRASPVPHEGADRPVLMDLQLRSGVARPLLTRQQLQGTPVVLDGVVPGHLAAVLEAEYPIRDTDDSIGR